MERGRRRRERIVQEERGGQMEEGLGERREEGVAGCKRIEEERWEGNECFMERNGKVNKKLMKMSSEKNLRSKDNRGSKTKEKPSLVKVSSEKNLKVKVGQNPRPSRRSLVVTRKEGKEVESLGIEKKKEKDRSLRKDRSTVNLQEGGKQNQTDEKSLHPPKKSPKNRQGITNLNLQNEKETNFQKRDLSTKKLEGVRPPPLLLPHGQSLATLQLNLAELSHIRKQVGFKYLNFQFNPQTGVKRLAGGKKSKRKSEN